MKTFTINSLSEATGFDRRTVSRRLGDLKPDGAGEYSGPEAFARIYSYKGKSGALQAAEIRRKNAQAEMAELDVAARKKAVLPTDSVLFLWQQIAIDMRSVVRGSSLSEVEKRELLKCIRDLQLKDYENQNTGQN